MELYSRKLFLLPYKNEAPFRATPTHQNTTSTSPTLLSPTTAPPEQHHSNHAHPFDSSIALTILVLLTALFFVGFFSIYIRRFSNNELFSRRHNDPPTTSRPPRATAGRKGLDPEVVKSLPVYSYYGEDAKYRINECPICLGDFEDKENVKLIPSCGHVFHLECIDTWLGMHETCPVCRGTQFMESGRKKKEVDESGRSTVDLCLEIKELGVRRTSSCSSLGNRKVLLARTSSL